MKLLSRIMLVLVLFLAFAFGGTQDYERDLKITFKKEKFGVWKEYLVEIFVTNTSSNREYKLAFLEKTKYASNRSEMYVFFNGFMQDNAGKWVKLKTKPDISRKFLLEEKLRPVKVKPGKSVSVSSLLFDARKVFEVGEKKGKIKFTADYIYTRKESKLNSDTALVNIPAFTLHSDTLEFFIEK